MRAVPIASGDGFILVWSSIGHHGLKRPQCFPPYKRAPTLLAFLCRIAAGALPYRGWRRRAPPDRVWRPLAALLNYKARVPLSLSIAAFAGILGVPFILSPCSRTFASRPGLLRRPSLFLWCANHLFSDAPHYDLDPPSILPRSTPLWWPPVSIRSPLDHTFLVGGLALTMTSTPCLVVPVAGRLLVRWP